MRNTLMGLALCAALVLAITVTGCKKEESAAPIEVPKGIGALPSSIDSEVKGLEAILAKDPKNYNVLVKLGNIYMDAQRFKEAIEVYDRALQINGSDQNVRVDLGTCYRSIGRSDVAVEVYRKAISMDPKHAMAHMNLGIVLAYDFGKTAEAVKELEKFVELAPAHSQVSVIRQEIARMKGETGGK